MTSSANNRIQSIDLLKGIVMVVMALDHVRDYFHYPANFYDPTDPAHTSLPIFFTRWITHFCAPGFSFLAGMSAYMVGRRKPKAELSGFLFKRGLWLVFIEISIVNFAWFFDPHFRTFGLLVIWSLGISMIVLAALVYAPKNFILIFCCLLIFGHNLLDSIHSNGNVLWEIMHEENMVNLPGNRILFIGYPLIPWIAVMGLGYYCGRFYDNFFGHTKRKKLFNIIGLASITLFLVLRYTNVYGNPSPWQPDAALSKEIVSFLNPAKYPPSLLYLLMTLGGAFLFLANSERLKGSAVNFFCTFGRVPFFYYILHLFVIHIAAMIAAQLTGFGWQVFILPTWIAFVPSVRGYGFNLLTVYLIWIAIIAILYPVCKKFDRYKQQHREKWWLSYL